jgi:hypothetical protein
MSGGADHLATGPFLAAEGIVSRLDMVSVYPSFLLALCSSALKASVYGRIIPPLPFFRQIQARQQVTKNRVSFL